MLRNEMISRGHGRVWSIGVLLWSSVCIAQAPPTVAPASSSRTANSEDACQRDRRRAIELSNEGDQLFKVDVRAALAKYARATELYPQEHRIWWKLASANDRLEDWPHMLEALQHAVALAPSFANYWYRIGYALVNQAQAGDRSAYQRARAPLEGCIARDPNIAECHYLLAEALLWTGDERAALLAYTRAIEKSPATGYFYPALADAYLSLGLLAQAEAVLREAARQIPNNERNRTALRGIYMQLATSAIQRGDRAAQLAAMERAEEYADENQPEFAFQLGAAYATMIPPEPARAKRLLTYFTKAACGSGTRFKGYCDFARSLLVRLGAP